MILRALIVSGGLSMILGFLFLTDLAGRNETVDFWMNATPVFALLTFAFVYTIVNLYKYIKG